jgi:N-methylhydantoinase B
MPGARLNIAPNLVLHNEVTDDLDPVTYEVIRYSLLQLNFEHASLLCRLAISPAVMITRDMQTTLLTEDGDVPFMGPGLQYFATASSLIAKWTLEHRAANPGIREGDMFICNDPYVGSPHQPDTCIAAPVFADGRLFGWVTNTMHHLDLGGIKLGSTDEAAEDIYHEGICLPPTMVMSGGQIRDDIVDLFARSSRMSPMVGMDLRASIAACGRARDQLSAVIAKYGAGAVKAVMRGTMVAARQCFEERLAQIPDGRWVHRVYAETCRPGDDGIFRIQVGVTKQGGRLVIDNRDTDPQAGSLNCGFGAFSGAVLAAVTANLVSDLSGCYGGVYSNVDFDLEPGLLNCAEFPAAVGPVGSRNAMLNIHAAGVAVAKMMSCGTPAMRARALGPNTTNFYGAICAGSTPTNGPFAMFDADGMIGALGARAGEDGVDAGGHFWIPEGIGANVEHNEQSSPVVALYRRLVSGGAAGAGRFRGGRGVEVGYMMHGADAAILSLYKNETIPKTQGLWGANPGSLGSMRVKTEAHVDAALAEGRIPQNFSELDGVETPLPYSGGTHPPMTQGDVWTMTNPVAPGHGDPLLRDPVRVAEDLTEAACSVDTAESTYGVVFDSAGMLDVAATAKQRAAIREHRLGYAPRRDFPADDAMDPGRVGDALCHTDGAWSCRCGAELGRAVSYKELLVRRETTGDRLGTSYASPDPQMAARMSLREFFCPDCGVRVEAEMARADDSDLCDIEFAG